MKIKLSRKTCAGMVAIMMVALLLAVGTIPSTAGASPWADARGRKGDMFGKGRHRTALGLWQNQQMVEHLELSQEQIQKLRDADFTSREKRLELKSRLEQLRLQMDKAFSAEGADRNTVRQLAQKSAGVKGQIFVLQIEDRLTLESILTSDQVRKLKRNAKHLKPGEPGIGMSSDAKGRLAARSDCWECRRIR